MRPGRGFGRDRFRSRRPIPSIAGAFPTVRAVRAHWGRAMVVETIGYHWPTQELADWRLLDTRSGELESQLSMPLLEAVPSGLLLAGMGDRARGTEHRHGSRPAGARKTLFRTGTWLPCHVLRRSGYVSECEINRRQQEQIQQRGSEQPA